MKIEHVCPKAQKPVNGTIVGNETIIREVWKAKEEGLSGKETHKYKSIIVECDFCNKTHEYALVIK